MTEDLDTEVFVVAVAADVARGVNAVADVEAVVAMGLVLVPAEDAVTDVVGLVAAEAAVAAVPVGAKREAEFVASDGGGDFCRVPVEIFVAGAAVPGITDVPAVETAIFGSPIKPGPDWMFPGFCTKAGNGRLFESVPSFPGEVKPVVPFEGKRPNAAGGSETRVSVPPIFAISLPVASTLTRLVPLGPANPRFFPPA